MATDSDAFDAAAKVLGWRLCDVANAAIPRSFPIPSVCGGSVRDLREKVSFVTPQRVEMA